MIPRKDTIVLAAIEAIHASGLQAMSTKAIAKKLGVSESIIFKHFAKKSDLIIAVLEHFSQYDTAIIETSRARNMQPREALTYFFTTFAGYYENYPAITSITQAYDVLGHDPEIGALVKEIFTRRLRFVQAQIHPTRDAGAAHYENRHEDLASIFTGTFHELCLKWRLSGCEFPLRERVLSTLNVLMDNFGLE